MNFITLLGISVGLSMDALAVSVSSGCSIKTLKPAKVLLIAFAFGLFQALMPILGWLSGSLFKGYIEAFDHWIAFILLAVVGVKMIMESLHQEAGCRDEESFLRLDRLIVLSIATSIDALAVGLSFSFLDVGILGPAVCIGTVTLVLCSIGVVAGNTLRHAFPARIETAGGALLIFIGGRILFQHLFA